LLKIKTFARLYRQTKELNDIKHNLEKKVEERTAELIETNKELEASNTELQQYAFIASHDLQEPLRKIITFSQIVKERFMENKDASQYVNRIIASSERMRILINDLLSYSRLATDPDFVTASLNIVLRGAITDLELVIKEKKAIINIDDLPTIEMIPDQIRQVFQNIIGNAVKFAKPGATSEIKIWSDFTKEKSAVSKAVEKGAYCRIYISDNGIGFNEQYLDKIFTMFQRLHGRAEYQGTGIGLSIVKKIIEKHNGLVTAKSKENEGTTFILVLPVSQAAKPSAVLH
jgi:light-regulated signal transduction histidine kinase (bacteriophytochrome)